MPSRIVAPWALVALLTGLESAHAQEPALPTLPIQSYRLDNGLKVVLHRDPSVPRVTVCVAYHVGSKDERAGRTGFAHFFEHMMFRGTKNVPNYDIPLQEAGAQSNAETSEDMTVYYETVPSHWLERSLYLESERLAFLSSALDQEKFDTEREVVKNERRQSMDNVPYGLAEEVLLASVFPEGHPYSWSVIGSMADLNGSTLDDLRKFFAEFYHPGNATLCLVGDFDIEATRPLIARYFGPLQAGPARREVVAPPAPAVGADLTRQDKVQLPRVYWAWPTVADDHPDTPALDILAMVLTGGEASRLHRRLVLETRLATDVGAGSDTKEIAGLFEIEATAGEGKTIEAIEAILAEEIEKARTAAPTPAELARALAKIETGYYGVLTGPLERAKILASGFAQYDDPEHYRKSFARYFRVKADDVLRVARKYLVAKKVRLVVEPCGDAEPMNPPVAAGPKAGAADPVLADRAPSGKFDWSRMPGPAAPGEFRAPTIVRKTLSNGLDVWVVRKDLVPLVSGQLLIPFGTADDPAGKSGLADLSAAVLDKGTKRLTAIEMAEALDELGGSVGVGTGLDTTTYGFSSLARTLEPTLKLFGEVLKSPRLDAEDFDRERDLQLAALLQGPDNVGWIAQRAFRAILFGKDHPYGNPGQGYPATVKGLKLADVEGRYKAFVRPRGSTLIVVGAVDPDVLVEQLEAALGDWKGEAPKAKARAESPVKPEPGTVYLVDKPGAVQSVLSVGRRWIGRDDPRYFTTLVGNRVLGGDFLSRLNQNLREKNGFTYGAGSTFSYRQTGSVWLASTQVRADATAPALKELLDELDGLAGDRPFTNEELVVAQDSELQGYPEQFESPGTILGVLREMAEFRLPADYLATFLEKLRAIEPKEVSGAMVEVVRPEARVVLVVGDRKTIEPELKALKRFRRIVPVSPDGTPVGR